jgi:hypothetical protein
MKVFASRFLEAPTTEKVVDPKDWTWEPANKEVYNIYASGNNTRSNQSTYVAERDSRSDTDRPNEGLYIA